MDPIDGGEYSFVFLFAVGSAPFQLDDILASDNGVIPINFDRDIGRPSFIRICWIKPENIGFLEFIDNTLKSSFKVVRLTCKESAAGVRCKSIHESNLRYGNF